MVRDDMGVGNPRPPHATSTRRLAIICPVYNEEAVVPLFFARVLPVMRELSDRYAVDLVFLNNASTDGTLRCIFHLRTQWPATYVITMSRNVGYQRSLDCGLRHVKGDLFAFIDVDCEDPPEMLLDFVHRHEEGFDIVYGERVDREEAAAVKAFRKLFYRVLKVVADEEIILDMAEFSLFTCQVRDAMILETNSFPFVRAAIGRVGFKRVGIAFKRQTRIAGATHYNLLGMSSFAIAGILSASTLLLRLPVLLLPAVLLMVATLGAAGIAGHSMWAIYAAWLVGFAYLASTASCIALYVARTYKNGLSRPNAHVDYLRSQLQPDKPLLMTAVLPLRTSGL